MENHEMKGTLAEDYTNAKVDAACARKQLEQLNLDLAALGDALQNGLSKVRISGQRIELSSTIVLAEPRLNRTERVSTGILDLDHFSDLLAQYQESEARKTSLERDLREIGLGPLFEHD